ncbi:MAG: DUF488 domain-containing protein [Acidobacteriota bacterium]|nr:DUF488 domain-containing protein [Acidobacteriota bacterium]
MSAEVGEGEGGSGLTVYTIGHSNRGVEEFIGLLKAHGVETLADIRKLPGSNKYPHFNRDELSDSLARAGIRYVYLKELAGRRPPSKDSKNTVWRNRSFRAYADHMETDEFRRGVEELLGYAAEVRVAVMCSEAVWWRCHRALVADYLKATGVAVYHIMGESASKPHPYTSAAKVVDGKLSYQA